MSPKQENWETLLLLQINCNFWDGLLVLQGLWLVFKHNCFLVSQTAAVRGKSQSWSNKTTFPTGAKVLLVRLWEYKEADIYMDVSH